MCRVGIAKGKRGIGEANPQVAESKMHQNGYKINILNEKFYFLHSTNFKVLGQIKQNSTSN
jgi:hypothetical protein